MSNGTDAVRGPEAPPGRLRQELGTPAAEPISGACEASVLAVPALASRNIDGLSDVVQLGSPAAARAYLSIYSYYRPRFPATAIRGAQGFAPNGGINVVFASGDYAYLVGAGWETGSGQPPTTAQVIAAAKLLYRRVQGR